MKGEKPKAGVGFGETWVRFSSRSHTGTHREQHFTHETDPEHRKSKLGNGIWGVETGSDLLHALIVLIL